MSWSISVIGRPANVAKAIEDHSAALNGQSKVEFDDAKPHMIGLLNQNFAKPDSGYTEPVVKLDANGSGSAVNDEQRNRSCQVKIETFYTKLV